MAPAPTGTFLFVSPLEQHRVHWSLSWKAPLSLAAQLNVKLKDPSTAQVGSEPSAACLVVVLDWGWLFYFCSLLPRLLCED